MAENILVFGAGGHAKVVIDAIEKQRMSATIWVFDDNPATWGGKLSGYPVIGGLETLLQDSLKYPADCSIVAIGNNVLRLKIAAILVEHGMPLGVVIHPSAVVSRGAEIGAGTVLFANSVVNSDSCIGDNVIVNTGATIDHDCIISNGVHVAPGVNVCGGVSVGQHTFIGAGSVIIPGVKVGNNVTIGAGSTVLNDIKDNAKVAGTPAREI